MMPEEAEFVDRVGLFMEMLGATRTMGRVYGWLLICDPPQQSLSELTKALSVSKASVSTVARQLQDGGMIERLPSANRQHLYRVTPGGFSSVLDTQLSLMKPGIDVADFGLFDAEGGPRRATGTTRRLPRLLRVLRPGLPRRVDAAMERLPRKAEAIVATEPTKSTSAPSVGFGGVDEPGHPVPAGIRKPFARPILGDTAAAEAVDRIEYDWARMRRAMRPGSNQYMVRMRAKQLDDWSSRLPGPLSERRRAAPRVRHGHPGVPAASTGNRAVVRRRPAECDRVAAQALR